MRIYVCVKHVPDSAANIQIVNKNKIDETVTFLLNPYDEHAVTEAARIRDAHDGSEFIAVCLGNLDAEKTLRSAMAMGADRSILIQSDEPHDSILTARALKSAIDQDGGCPDLILTGKEAIDTEGMQTMFRLAALYDIPCANNVVAVNIGSGNTRVESELQGGTTEIYDLTLPCVLGAGRGLNTPKYPTFPDVVKARKKEVKIIELAELSFEKPKGSMAVIELTPLIQNRKVKELSGTKEEIASRIVRILKEEAKVL